MADEKISALSALAGASAANDDVLPVVDTSATETKKMTLAELFAAWPAAITAELTGAGVAATDEVLVSDNGTPKTMTVAELFAAWPVAISTELAGSGVASTDEVLVSDAGVPKTMSLAELITGFFVAISTTMAGSDVTEGTDEVLVSDGGIPKTMTFTELASAIVLATLDLSDIPEYADQAAAATALEAGKLFRFATTGALGIALT